MTDPFVHKGTPRIDTSYAKQVLTYVPDAEGCALNHRVELLKCRNWAAALRARTISILGSQLASNAHELAGLMVFSQHERVARLDLAATLCKHLISAALAADCLDSEETPL